jgi:tetratricopeptide (TPR) repeat protein
VRALIAIVVLAGLTATAAATTPAEDLAKAREEFKSGNFSAAAPKLSFLLYPSPRLAQPRDLVETHILLGVCYFETGDKADAARELEAALYIDPSYSLDENLFSSDARRFFEETKAAKAARDKAAAEARALAEERERIKKFRDSLRFVEKRQWWVNFMPFGAGQFQNGQSGKGIFFAATEAAAAGTSIAIFFYLTNKYGYGGQVPKEDAADVRLLQQIAIGADIVFYSVAILGIVDAYRNYEPEVVLQGDDSLLPPDLRDPKDEPPPTPKKKPKKSSFMFHPVPIPDGAGIGLSWEH